MVTLTPRTAIEPKNKSDVLPETTTIASKLHAIEVETYSPASMMPVIIQTEVSPVDKAVKAAEASALLTAFSTDSVLHDPGHGNFHAEYLQGTSRVNANPLAKYPTTIENENGRVTNLDLTSFNNETHVIYTTPGKSNCTICLMDGNIPRFLTYAGEFLVVTKAVMHLIEAQRELSADMRRNHQPCTPAMANKLASLFKNLVALEVPGQLGVGSVKTPLQIAGEINATKAINQMMQSQTLNLYGG